MMALLKTRISDARRSSAAMGKCAKLLVEYSRISGPSVHTDRDAGDYRAGHNDGCMGRVDNASDRKALIAYMRKQDRSAELCPK